MQLNAHALPLRPGLQSVMQTTPGILPPSAQDRNPSPRAKPASRRIFVVVLTPSDLALLQGPPHTRPLPRSSQASGRQENQQRRGLSGGRGSGDIWRWPRRADWRRPRAFPRRRYGFPPTPRHRAAHTSGPNSVDGEARYLRPTGVQTGCWVPIWASGSWFPRAHAVGIFRNWLLY